MFATLLLSYMITSTVVVQSAQDSLTVRILDLQNPQSVQIYSPSSRVQLVDKYSGEAEALIGVDDLISVNGKGDAISVSWSESSFDYSGIKIISIDGSPLHIRYSSNSNELQDRAYRGILEVQPDRETERRHLLITNRLHLEDYVSGVIPREYPFKKIEGIKAQAVIARTYALAARRTWAPRYDLTDTEASQVYGGALAENYASRRAVYETRGEVILYNGRMIEAVYSSTCGGHTANNEDAWGTAPVAYLRAREDPYDSHSPFYRWNVDLDKDDFFELLSERVGFDVTGVKVKGKATGGYVTSLTISGKGRKTSTLRPSTFRIMANRYLGSREFRSNAFSLDVKRSTIEVEGRGFGHGVGVCQYGVSGMADKGFSYDEIIQFYYTDVELKELADIAEWPNFSLEPAFPDRAIEPSFTVELSTERKREPNIRSAPRRRVSRRRISWNPWGRQMPEEIKRKRERKVW